MAKAPIVRTHQLSKSAVQRWAKRYRAQGLAGLVTTERTDKGKVRTLSDQMIILVQGLALQLSPRSAAAIHRQVVEIATQQGWKPPGYEQVRLIIKSIAPAFVILAHAETAAYREEFDLLYRRKASHANALWQADHTPLDMMLLHEEKQLYGVHYRSGPDWHGPVSPWWSMGSLRASIFAERYICWGEGDQSG